MRFREFFILIVAFFVVMTVGVIFSVHGNHGGLVICLMIEGAIAAWITARL